MSKRTIPLIVGSLLIMAMVGFVFIHRSSPGDLNRAHAAVAGSNLIMDCKKCHAPAGLTSGCLSCHTEIKKQLDERTGYHAYLAKNKKTECSPCHADHNGADFSMINQTSWEGKDVKSFKHPQVRFRLTGAHAKLTCEQCHQSKHHPPIALSKFPKTIRTNTYLGLSQACLSCHADPHANGKAWNCQSCHSQIRWKPAPFFNHDKYYRLLGVHATIACNQCHAPSHTTASLAKNPNAVFGPVKGTRCIDCHASPHHVKWKESCESCHSGKDTDWNTADHRLTRSEHDETGFRLVAPHNKVRCLDCHSPIKMGKSFEARYPDPRASGYNRSLTNCEGCHRDEHRGQFITQFPKCTSCHYVTGWKPTKFNVAMHNKVSYVLIGGHATASCNKCHTNDSSLHAVRYMHTPKECDACHRDIHYGQFRAANDKTRCENCHLNTALWSKIIFNHETQSKFKLREAHQKVACNKCHPLVTLRNGVRLVQYKPIKSQCSDCHGFDELQNR